MANDHSSNAHNADTDVLVNKKGTEEFQTLKASMVTSAHFIHDTYSGFISPLIPFLIERLSLLKVEASLFLFFYQGISILQPMIGHWADRFNLRKIALFAPAVTGIFLSLLGTASSFPVALLYCLLAGISSATMHAILPAIVGSYSGKNIGKGMSLWLVGGETGVMFGPIVITAVIATTSIKHTPWLMIGGIVISIILNILFRNEPYEAKNNLEHSPIPTKALLKIMLPLGMIILMRSLMRATIDAYLPVYMTEKGAGVWLAGASISILQGFGVAGVILGGLANDRFGHKSVMLASIIFSGINTLIFVFTDGIAQILSLTSLGAASMLMMPVGMAIAQENFPQNRSLANGVYLALLFAIKALSSVLSGFLYDQLGGQQTYLIGGLVIFFAIPFVFLLPDAKKSPTI